MRSSSNEMVEMFLVLQSFYLVVKIDNQSWKRFFLQLFYLWILKQTIYTINNLFLEFKCILVFYCRCLLCKNLVVFYFFKDKKCKNILKFFATLYSLQQNWRLFPHRYCRDHQIHVFSFILFWFVFKISFSQIFAFFVGSSLSPWDSSLGRRPFVEHYPIWLAASCSFVTESRWWRCTTTCGGRTRQGTKCLTFPFPSTMLTWDWGNQDWWPRVIHFTNLHIFFTTKGNSTFGMCLRYSTWTRLYRLSAFLTKHQIPSFAAG